MDVAVRDLNTNEFGVFVSFGAVDLAILVIDVAGNVLGETVTCLTEASTTSVDFERVVAGRALSRVVLEVVETPGLSGCQGSRETVVRRWGESNGFG